MVNEAPNEMDTKQTDPSMVANNTRENRSCSGGGEGLQQLFDNLLHVQLYWPWSDVTLRSGRGKQSCNLCLQNPPVLLKMAAKYIFFSTTKYFFQQKF